MTRVSQSTYEAQPETTTFDRREESVALDTLAAEAERVEQAQRRADDPEAHETDFAARPTCPFCGDTNCSQHTEQ